MTFRFDCVTYRSLTFDYTARALARSTATTVSRIGGLMIIRQYLFSIKCKVDFAVPNSRQLFPIPYNTLDIPIS